MFVTFQFGSREILWLAGSCSEGVGKYSSYTALTYYTPQLKGAMSRRSKPCACFSKFPDPTREHHSRRSFAGCGFSKPCACFSVFPDRTREHHSLRSFAGCGFKTQANSVSCEAFFWWYLFGCVYSCCVYFGLSRVI
jgi:hypothetical protein